MEDINFKAVTFVENGDILHGHYFYDAANDSDHGHIFGIIGLTLPKAIIKMKEKGIDPIKNFKMSIAAYY